MTNEELLRLLKKVTGEPVPPHPLTEAIEALGGRAGIDEGTVPWVSFTDSNVGDRAAVEIGKLPDLVKLTLYDEELTDEGMRHLQWARKLQELELAALG